MPLITLTFPGNYLGAVAWLVGKHFNPAWGSRLKYVVEIELIKNSFKTKQLGSSINCTICRVWNDKWKMRPINKGKRSRLAKDISILNWVPPTCRNIGFKEQFVLRPSDVLAASFCGLANVFTMQYWVLANMLAATRFAAMTSAHHFLGQNGCLGPARMCLMSCIQFRLEGEQSRHNEAQPQE